MLTFDEAKHEYKLADRPILSVTQIIKAVRGVDDRWFTDEARDRGTSVHRTVEAFIKYGDEECHPLLAGYLEAFKRAQKELEFDIVESELLVYSSAFRYAGTLDLVAILRGDTTVIDFKTGSDLPSYALQTAAYAAAYEELRGIPITKRAGLYLAGDGSYKLVPHEEEPGELPHIEVFRSMAIAANWKLANNLMF
jgi:RecB family exonuclease